MSFWASTCDLGSGRIEVGLVGQYLDYRAVLGKVHGKSAFIRRGELGDQFWDRRTKSS